MKKLKTNIRYSMFETNSSSVHVIVIPLREEYDIPKEIEFKLGTFGWDFDCISPTADYLYTAILKICPERFEVLLNKLEAKGIVVHYNKDDILKAKSNTLNWNYYIDHAGKLVDFLEKIFSDDNLLYRLLFAKSYVLTGNDNVDYVEGVEKTAKLPKDEYYVYIKGN